MKICYVAAHGSGGNQDELHIGNALEELGHDVLRVQQSSRPVIEPCDLLLFHHWYDADLEIIRQAPATKRACWYFDKAWHGREDWLKRVYPLLDRLFITDETWLRANGLDKGCVLRQGLGVRGERGTARPGKWTDIVFTGSPYGERADWVRVMKQRWGKRFSCVQGVHGRELYDLCETAKIVVAPSFPGDDLYWSNRLYLVLGSGGFLIHPKFKGMNREVKDGTHYVGYTSQSELDRQIAYFLDHPAERERIRLTGMRQIQENYTYKDRAARLIKTLCRA